MRRLLCFGDSNTYGFDPRSRFGSRYPRSVRWTGLLGPEYEVLNAGQNGRTIPSRPGDLSAVGAMIRESAPLGAFLVMLGSNDLLNFSTAEGTAERMRRFLAAIAPALEDTPVLLIAPPPFQPGAWVSGPDQLEQSARYAARCRAIAREMGVLFADSGEWGVELAFDGVHFTEDGHRAFADGLRKTLSHMSF